MSDIEHDAHTRGPVQLSPGQPVRYDKTSFKGKVKAVGVRCSHDIPTNQRGDQATAGPRPPQGPSSARAQLEDDEEAVRAVK
eukprot:1175410-Prorocentrum_minimum.AAC.3